MKVQPVSNGPCTYLDYPEHSLQDQISERNQLRMLNCKHKHTSPVYLSCVSVCTYSVVQSTRLRLSLAIPP